MNNTITEKSFVIKPATHKQLATQMGVSARVLHTWLRPLHTLLYKKGSAPYSLEQVLLIYKIVGLPLPQTPEIKTIEEALCNI